MRKFRKHRRPGNRAMTKSESAHVDCVKRAGCVCCAILGFEHDPDGYAVEADHLKSGNIRIGHMHVIGLCPYHHRDVLIINGWNHAKHREVLGPSKARGLIPFLAHFGGLDAILQKQDEMLAEVA